MYPMKEHLGIFPIGISVLTTNQVTEMTVDGTLYKHYPVIDLKASKDDVPNKFIEVIQLPNTYLQAIGGDYDGDQITAKAVFSAEANLEAEEKMRSMSNILSINGNNVRTSSIEVIQTLYMCTRWKNPNETFRKI